uniref:Putative ovule protein n=1 Tax=Solanum chacoense TaxID=4108 RepID=A0A0V0H3S3_SOLCH
MWHPLPQNPGSATEANTCIILFNTLYQTTPPFKLLFWVSYNMVSYFFKTKFTSLTHTKHTINHNLLQ